MVISPTFAASDPVPVQQAPTDDSIAAAKRDLDSLKKSSNAAAAGSQSNALPPISVPLVKSDDVLEPTTAATNPPTIDDAKAAEKKKANWLVDAMMKPKDSRDGEEKRGRKLSRDPHDDLSADADEKKADGGRRGDDAKGNDDGSDAVKSPTVTNPLAQYMANWMSPQDYALLRHTVDATHVTESNPAPPAASLSAPPTADGLTALGGIDADAIAAPRSNSKPSTPADNPYLAALALPDATPPPAPPPPAPSVAPSASAPPLFAPPPPPEEQKPTIPDFAKSLEDDKIFKPLKRF